MATSDGGKGSDRRPGEGYASGWDRIYGADKKKACEGVCSQCSRSASGSESKASAVSASMCGDPLKGVPHGACT